MNDSPYAEITALIRSAWSHPEMRADPGVKEAVASAIAAGAGAFAR